MKVYVVTSRYRVPWHSYLTEETIIGIYKYKSAADEKAKELRDYPCKIVEIDLWEHISLITPKHDCREFGN